MTLDFTVRVIQTLLVLGLIGALLFRLVPSVGGHKKTVVREASCASVAPLVLAVYRVLGGDLFGVSEQILDHVLASKGPAAPTLLLERYWPLVRHQVVVRDF